ncbi:YhgE/Pip domain-containing protein [Effusibacillus consociatus]|uniref:YhgE/Pip domain-containing protein n=2 Tax=Effusibacillus consociatus TaxID=1117041 RepID=A0ABV9Q2C7_9BACL
MTVEAAMDRLEQRDVQMVLQIPADFSKQLQSPGQKGTLHYTINESNPAMVKNVMQGVLATITAQVNREAVANGVEVALKQAGMPTPQGQAMAKGISERVTADVKSIHPVSSFAIQMIPMMLILASYVGAMIMGLNFCPIFIRL